MLTRRDFKLTVIAATVSALASLSVSAAIPAEPTQSEKDNLTVEQAIAITNGLRLLTKYETVDKEGKPGFGYYDFSADTRFVIAINIDLGSRVEKLFQNANNDLVVSFSGGSAEVPTEKKGAFMIEQTKLTSAPSRVGFYHIKKEDLKLDKNPIPAPILSLILPIIDGR